MNKKIKEKKSKIYEVIKKESFFDWMEEGSSSLIVFSISTFLGIFILNIPYEKEYSQFIEFIIGSGILTTSIILGLLSALIILYIVYFISVKRIVKVKK